MSVIYKKIKFNFMVVFIFFSFVSVDFCKASSECVQRFYPDRRGPRIVLNAEAFGFGPTAATAQLFLKLKSQMSSIAYIGESHTLDLQRNLPYDQIIKIPTGATDLEIREQLRGLVSEYTYFFTSLDFRYAMLARAEGFKVGVYDPLTWFWNPFPETAKDVDLYVAQDFIGVREKIHRQRSQFPERTKIIAPIVPALLRKHVLHREPVVLINLGGLMNSFIPNDVMFRYAQLIAESCEFALATSQTKYILTTNTQFAQHMPSRMHATSLTPSHIQGHLETARLALMTSGLGNLMEASAAAAPVVWLPPSNDSQGQQIALLKQRDMIDGSLDWADFTEMPAIDYFQPQEKVMAEIQLRMELVLATTEYQQRLRSALRQRIGSSLAYENASLKITKFIDEYGQGGIQDLAEMIQEWILKNEATH